MSRGRGRVRGAGRGAGRAGGRALEADIVIVGAGSAGAALAARLSEDPAVSVLLLEAGPPDRALELHVPAAFSKLFRGVYDWNYDTEPQPALEGRRVYWPRGKTLGGSSSLNAMMWVRGFAADYDEWASVAGDTWSWDALVPYFRRVERTQDAADPSQGIAGAQSVEHQRHPRPQTAAFLDAARELGHAVTPANLPVDQGFSETMVTQRRGGAGIDGGRVPASGPAPPEPPRRDRGARAAGPLRHVRRGPAGDRRRDRARRRRAGGGRSARGRAVRRRDQHPAAAAPERHRTGGAPRRPRHPHARGRTGCRREPAGSPRRGPRAGRARRHAVRRGARRRAGPLPRTAPGHAHLERRRGVRVHPHAARRRSRTRRGSARHRDPLRGRPVCRRRARAAAGRGAHGRRDPAAPAQPRHHPPRIGGPRGGGADRPGLSERPGRDRRADPARRARGVRAAHRDARRSRP